MEVTPFIHEWRQPLQAHQRVRSIMAATYRSGSAHALDIVSPPTTYNQCTSGVRAAIPKNDPLFTLTSVCYTCSP